MNSGAVTPAVTPPRRTAHRIVAVIGTFVLAIAVVAFVRVLVSWPHSPPAGTTTSTHARERMEQDAWKYADALAVARRTAALTPTTLPTPGNPSVGTPTVTTRHGTTVVTFSTHASFGSADARTPVTACYRATLTSGIKAPAVVEVAGADCRAQPVPASTYP
ncbi:hypothetical protein ACIQI8_09585 [Streptomyces sp. NPDC092369]|uniref:hypothetical protein n=1 Tax=Streptomyces sp. NPDC092369 TaxID=3366015 RepID=UPI0037FE15D9